MRAISVLRGAAVLLAMASAGDAAMWDDRYMDRLLHAELVNERQVLSALSILHCAENQSCAFTTRDPFYPATLVDDDVRVRMALANELPFYKIHDGKVAFPAFEPVFEWYMRASHDQAVCGLEILSANEDRTVFAYRLQTLRDRFAAGSRFHITHKSHCGACSSLKDLYVYKSLPDLTRPASRCAAQFPLSKQLACMKKIGFSDTCAEAWAYNARSTRNRCARICMETHSSQPAPLPLATESRLRRAAADQGEQDDAAAGMTMCLMCDEYVSGPGFKYAAGRTRRSSGLNSSIERSPEEIYPHADHNYFGDS